MTLIRYSLQTAYTCGENRHPQLVILEHFPEALDFEPVSVADCWLFRAEWSDTSPAYFVNVDREQGR